MDEGLQYQTFLDMMETMIDSQEVEDSGRGSWFWVRDIMC